MRPCQIYGFCTSESLCAEHAGRRLVSGYTRAGNEDEEKKKALNEMDTCLAGKKNPVVVPLLTECASYISNLLNDVYIEEKMCSLFPGSIKRNSDQPETKRGMDSPVKRTARGKFRSGFCFFKGTCTVCSGDMPIPGIWKAVRCWIP